jgi:hypothetical protein
MPAAGHQNSLSCTVYDFQPYWQSVFKVFLTEILSAHKVPSQLIKESPQNPYTAEAREKTDSSAEQFAALLEYYPELCKLKHMHPDRLSNALFSLMMHELKPLHQALKNSQLTAEYFSTTALSSPHFATNLLGQIQLLGSLIYTLEVNEEQKFYFERLARTYMSNDQVSPREIRVYSKAFSHLLLMINEGAAPSLLDRYSRTVSAMDDNQLDEFLLLNQFSTAEIPTFLDQMKPASYTVCHWYYPGQRPGYKVVTCGNTAGSMLANVSLILP